jgi:Zn-dependent M28 family amino/carboxypeptidase
MGIVLSIAKYMKELKDNYSIDPKYKVKFIGFSGEEAGLRGALYYETNHSIFHNYEHIKTFIDLNQFGFNYTKNQESLHMNLTTNKKCLST